MKKFLSFIFGFLLISSVLIAADEGKIYFNAGTEKYLQGNYTEAVENLEKAQTLEPKNTRIKDFMVKILLEAATQSHLNRNYKQAYIYIQKAESIAPSNLKVQELYLLTKEIVEPNPEKIVKSERPALPKQIQEEITEAVAKGKSRAETPAETQKAVKTYDNNKKPQGIVRGISAEKESQDTIKTKNFYLFSVAFFMILTIVLAMMLRMKSLLLVNKQNEIHKIETDYKLLAEEKNNMKLEFEKMKEKIKYEQKMTESLQRELKEISKKEEERVQFMLKQAEEKIRAEMEAQYKVEKAGSKENFVEYQEEKFLKYLSTFSEQNSAPALESTRERIALMAQNLFDYAPGAAIDFLSKMVKNENALVRSNVVYALAYIAKPETLDMLFDLFYDKDSRVKREVLKSIKQLYEKHSAGAVNLDKVALEKIRYLINEERTRGEWIV